MLTVTALTLTRAGGTPVIATADFSVRPGAPLCVLSSPGAGATLLAEAIVGRAPIANGRISFDGYAFASLSTTSQHALRREIAWLPEVPELVPHLSTYDNVALAMDALGVRRDGVRLAALLDELDLTSVRDVAAADLSQAQKQRVGVARALARPTRYLIADCPTSYQAHEANCVWRALSTYGAAATCLVFERSEGEATKAPRAWETLRLLDGRVGAPPSSSAPSALPLVIDPLVSSPFFVPNLATQVPG